MKRLMAFLKSKLILFAVCSIFAVPVFTTLTACGDEINGPRVEDDQIEKGGGTEGESE